MEMIWPICMLERKVPISSRCMGLCLLTCWNHTHTGALWILTRSLATWLRCLKTLSITMSPHIPTGFEFLFMKKIWAVFLTLTVCVSDNLPLYRFSIIQTEPCSWLASWRCFEILSTSASSLGPHTDPRLVTFCNRDVSSRSLVIGAHKNHCVIPISIKARLAIYSMWHICATVAICVVVVSFTNYRNFAFRVMDENYGIWLLCTPTSKDYVEGWLFSSGAQSCCHCCLYFFK